MSENLWKKVLKCKMRKIEHKIFNINSLPIKPAFNRFNYAIEFIFREKIVENLSQFTLLNYLNQFNNFDMAYFNYQQQFNENENKSNIHIDSHVLYLDIKNGDEIFETFKTEWLAMCQMYKLVRQVYKAFKQYPDLKKQMRILNFNFKQLVIAYGVNFGYKIIFQWSKETKIFDIFLIANVNNNSNGVLASYETPMINYQFMFINEIRKLFNKKHLNIVNLIQTLNETYLPSYSLAKLYNLPKFYAYQQTIVPLAGFMLTVVSLTHFKLTYYSRYCLEIHMHNNGLVSIRDGSFGLTDISMALEDLHPIQLLSVS